LFRHYYALPSARDRDGREVAAVRGVLGSVLGMIHGGATHVAVATDHVIESFRNELWPGYKTGEGIAPDLLAQFELLEEVLSAAGVTVWPMVEFEADDALAAGAATAARDARVERVIVCTPDKDLAQCVCGRRVVQLDRRRRVTFDEAGVIGKFGVPPESIPDYLALVGDAADGYPGLPGWGAKSSAAVLAKFAHLEFIPVDWREWRVNAANASALASTLSSQRDLALLFRRLATLRTDIALFDDVDELQWRGPEPGFESLGARLDAAVAGSKRHAGRRPGSRYQLCAARTMARRLASGAVAGIAQPALRIKRPVSAKRSMSSRDLASTSSGVPNATTALGSRFPMKTIEFFISSWARRTSV
jgi:5'-3' exonuclease